MKFKLVIYPALDLGSISVEYKFETKKEMVAALDTCADLLIFMQDKAKIMDDFSNALIMYQFIENKWAEID